MEDKKKTKPNLNSLKNSDKNLKTDTNPSNNSIKNSNSQIPKLSQIKTESVKDSTRPLELSKLENSPTYHSGPQLPTTTTFMVSPDISKNSEYSQSPLVTSKNQPQNLNVAPPAPLSNTPIPNNPKPATSPSFPPQSERSSPDQSVTKIDHPALQSTLPINPQHQGNPSVLNSPELRKPSALEPHPSQLHDQPTTPSLAEIEVSPADIRLPSDGQKASKEPSNRYKRKQRPQEILNTQVQTPKTSRFIFSGADVANLESNVDFENEFLRKMRKELNR